MTEDVAANEPFAVKEIDLSANTILTANFLASYTNGGPLSGDFAEAWFTVPVFGDKVNVTIGAKATLDGKAHRRFPGRRRRRARHDTAIGCLRHRAIKEPTRPDLSVPDGQLDDLGRIGTATRRHLRRHSNPGTRFRHP